MTIKTHQVRLAIQQRLALLRPENGLVSNIQAVLNPVGARDKSKIPKEGCCAVLWTEDSEALDSSLSAMHWKQHWAIDIGIDWEDDGEFKLDHMKLEIASVLLPKIDGVKKQSLKSFKTSYPANGSGRALISVEITTEYIEALKPLNFKLN